MVYLYRIYNFNGKTTFFFYVKVHFHVGPTCTYRSNKNASKHNIYVVQVRIHRLVTYVYLKNEKQPCFDIRTEALKLFAVLSQNRINTS